MKNYRTVESLVESISETHEFNLKEYIFLNTSDILRGSFLNKKFFKKDELKGQAKKKILKDDILLSEIRPKNNRYAYVNFEDTDNYVVSTKLMVLRNITKDVLTKYIYYLITNQKTLNYLQSLAENRIGSFPQITYDILKKLRFHIPNEKTQKETIINLEKFDDLINHNNQIISSLQNLIKTIFTYWYLQFNFPDEESKPYKLSGGNLVFNEEIQKKIPHGWEVKTLGSILSDEIYSKKIPSNYFLSEGLIPIIDQDEGLISGYTNDKNSIIKVSNNPYIVFGDHSRRLKLINFNFARGADGTQLIYSNNSRMPQRTLYTLLSLIELGDYGYARHFKFLKKVKLIIPDNNTSKKLEAILKNYYDAIDFYNNQNLYLNNLKDRLFSFISSKN